MDNATVIQMYAEALDKLTKAENDRNETFSNKDQMILRHLKKKGFEGNMKKMKAVLSGQKKKVKSAVKQIEKADGIKKLPRYALSTMNEIFSGLTYEQWPKVNALFQSLFTPGLTYEDALQAFNEKMRVARKEAPIASILSNMAGGVITGSAELKLLQKSGLLPGIMTLKSGQPIRNIGRSSVASGVTTYPGAVVVADELEQQGNQKTDDKTLLDEDALIMTGASMVGSPVLDVGAGGVRKLGNFAKRKFDEVTGRVPPPGDGPPPPTGSIGGMSGPERSALSDLDQSLQSDVPEGTDAIRQAILERDRRNLPLTFSDKLMTGPATRRLASRSARTGPEMQAKMNRFFTDRITGPTNNPLYPDRVPEFQGPSQSQRVTDAVTDLLGEKTGVLTLKDTRKKKRSNTAGPLYDKAYYKYKTVDNFGNEMTSPNMVEVTPLMRELFQRPSFQEAFRKAQKNALDDGFFLPENLFELDTISVQQVDYIQRALKGSKDIGTRTMTIDDEETLRLVRNRNDFLEQVDNQLADASPDGRSPFLLAREFWAGDKAYDEAFDAGVKAMTGSETADDILFRMNKMGDSEKEGFKLGMVNGIMKKVEGVVPTQEGVEAVRTGPLQSAKVQRILESLFPDGDRVNEFMFRMKTEQDMTATLNKIFSGSQTAERVFDDTRKSNLPNLAMDALSGVDSTVRNRLINMGADSLIANRLGKESDTLGRRLSTTDTDEMMKTLSEVDEIRKVNQMLMRQGLLTQGGIPGGLTGIYPMSLLE